MSRRTIEIRRYGVVPYTTALDLQRDLVEQRRANTIPDQLLLLQHPPVLTLGVRADGGRSNILAEQGELEARGIEIAESGRGGDVTYHGPGQIVGYPILDLRPDRCDVHRYVRDLEETMIRTCGDFGLAATRISGMTGTWLGDEKIGAIGVRISRWITSHGFAFNVSTTLEDFALIVPCGIAGHGVTSLTAALGRDVTLAEVESVLEHRFCEVFDRRRVEAVSML